MDRKLVNRIKANINKWWVLNMVPWCVTVEHILSPKNAMLPMALNL